VTVIVKNTKINEALHLFHNMVECLCELSELVITYKPEVDRRGHVIGHVADMAEVLLLIKVDSFSFPLLNSYLDRFICTIIKGVG
jgi:hypothetical protein